MNFIGKGNTCFFGATGTAFSSSLSSDCELEDVVVDDEVASTGGVGGVTFFFFLFADFVSVCCFLALVSFGFFSLFEGCFDEDVDFDLVDDVKNNRNATVETNINARVMTETMVTVDRDALPVNCSNNDPDVI